VDYSKWDNLDLSDDEDAPKKPASRKVEPAAPAKIEKPKEAQGSAWNANNYHFEEQKLDVWGRARLKEILKQTVALEIEHQGQNFPFTMAFGVDKMEADVWSHIRKGKTAVGYNIELELGVDGQVTAGPRQEPVLGSISADLMVDNDPEFSLSLSKGVGLPFTPQIQTVIKSEFISRFNAFVAELKAKADAHKEKVETSASAAPKLAQEAAAKSHFGGRVQVGGHNPGGLRLS